MREEKDIIYDDTVPFKFTERYIQDVLNGFFAMNTQKYNIENLYVYAWESDKLIKTRSGLFYEFEIKVSRGDFKNDFKNKEDRQEITVGQNGNNITFRFKKKVLPISNEEYSAKKVNELEKVIPTSAKILCQTGDTVYDKYTSYVSHKLKVGDTIDDEVEKKFAKLQKKLIAFEDFIGNINNGEKWIEYGNIYLGGLEHAINGRYHTFYDNTDSRISITLTEAPTLEKIKLIADIIKDLFDLDPETKVILTS